MSRAHAHQGALVARHKIEVAMEELEILGRLTREAAAPVKRMSRHGPARAEQSRERGGG